jgi:nitrite reductase/ring-hydroxylating ferredoxin subunit
MPAAIGSAYDLPPPSYRGDLTEVERGTPMGELLRRYWHPVGLAADATATPRLVRVLGEELILFRDGAGRAGLVYPRCMHRGASLYYGRGEERGIRCCYHGWLFDVEGNCLEQPCEPGGGRQLHRFRQPWYPVEERYGLIFAYMGPPDRRPPLPRHALLEDVAPGLALVADDSSIGSGGPQIVPCNWLQHYENVMDPLHVPILHGLFSGVQFVPEMVRMPEVRFEKFDYGIRSTQLRKLDDGRTIRRITEVVLPSLRVVASPTLERIGPCTLVGWVLPIDSGSFRVYSAGTVPAGGRLSARSTFNGKTWFELTEAEHQRMPGDYECQVSQGRISYHSEEHLTSSDKGVSMLRQMLRRQVETVAAGGNPVGADPAAKALTIASAAGNFIEG